MRRNSAPSSMGTASSATSNATTAPAANSSAPPTPKRGRPRKIIGGEEDDES